MVGIWKSYADIYLIIAGVLMLLTFGIPLTFAPMRWARLFRWAVPQSQELVTFLGRSLGVFISIMGIFAIVVIQTPAAMPFYFNLILVLFGGMILLHIYGAIRKVQPITETFEILLWVILGLITLGFYPL